MSELLFEYCGNHLESNSESIIKLSSVDTNTYNEHLKLCGQREISEAEWREVYANDTVYYLLFEKGIPVARAAIEKLSNDVWEISDVRTAKPFRNRGFSERICRYVISHILSENRKVTIRAESDNLPMLRVIEKLGFKPCKNINKRNNLWNPLTT